MTAGLPKTSRDRRHVFLFVPADLFAVFSHAFSMPGAYGLAAARCRNNDTNGAVFHGERRGK
jgi:hypothetical protein